MCAAPASAASGTYGLTSAPDYVDPSLSYTVEGWSIFYATHTGLLTYEHAEGAAGQRVVPGLAESLPDVSDDGLTYTLRLREGLRYSNGREVRARDVAHTIRRIRRLRSGGSAFFLGIRRIRTDDAARTVTFTLHEPDSSFPQILATSFAGIVPSGTPTRYRRGRPPPGVGPMRIVRSTRRGLLLAKNPDFDIPGLPQAALDRITVRYRVRPGTVDVHIDPPPADRLREVRDRAGDRLREIDTVSTYYFFLNQRLAPFHKAEVRKAVHFALDKPGLARLFGGLFRPGCTVLPPGMPGHRDQGCPFGDPNGEPQVERAREMVRAAGAEGARVNVYGNDEIPTRPVTRAFAATLRSIGLRPRLRIVPARRYFATIGSSRSRAHAGYGNWFQDFAHPSNFLFLFDGDSIQPRNNQNHGNVDDAQVNDLIDRVRTDNDMDAAAAADRRIVEEAYAIPFGSRRLAHLFSERVPPECRAQHPTFMVDLARLCVR